MDKNIKTILCLLGTVLLSMAVSGCSNREVEEPLPAEEQHSGAVTFRASSMDTKTAFGEPDGTTYPTLWTSNDVSVMISQDYAAPGEAPISVSDDSRSCTFSFEPEPSSVYNFYAMTPSSAATSISPSRKSWLVTIPSNQTPLATSPDEGAQILAAKSETMYELPEEVDVHFSHVTAYGKMTLKNLDLGEAAISSITLVSSATISGSWYYDIEEQTLVGKDVSYSLNLATSSTENIWFAWAPVDLSGTTLKVIVHTDKGDFTKTATFPSGRQLVAGRIASFSVNMAGIEAAQPTVTLYETVFKRVTSSSDLSVDDEIIIVNSEATPTFAMTSSASSSGIAAVASSSSTGFTVGSDGYIRLASGSSVMVLTVANLSNSKIRLGNGAGSYLYLNNSQQNRYLSLSSSYTDWTLSFSDGQARLYSGNNNRSYIRYNNSYFNVSTNSSYVYIYKKTDVSTEMTVDEEDPVVEYEQYGAYISGDPMIYNPATDQLSREYSSGMVCFSILDPARLNLPWYQAFDPDIHIIA